MSNRFIDDFNVILLDMGNTFMFGVDRFGPSEDYYATYRQIGGEMLSPEHLRLHIDRVFECMLTASRDPTRYDDFGNVCRFLRKLPDTRDLSESERDLIAAVFGRHEVGTVPETNARALRELRESHPLGLVSNVWSLSSVFEEQLEKAGVRDLFSVRVWSSDHLSIKPSAHLFQKALDVFSVDPSRVLYVGDNPKRDLAGAKALGMGTVWIENEERPLAPEDPQPDLIIADLTKLPGAIKTRSDIKQRAEQDRDASKLHFHQ